MEEQNKSSYNGPFWRSNGAIHIVLNALEDIELTLGSMIEETDEVQDALTEYYSKYNDDDSSDEAMEAFSDICENLWHLESNLSSYTRTAILMSVVYLESDINKFCFFNLGETTTDSIERLSLIEKLEVIHAVLGLSSFKGTRPYQALRTLVNWRNAFVHGKCTDMPYNKIKENHLKTPNKFPDPGDEVKELLNLMEEYLMLCKYLPKISRHPYTSGPQVELEDIKESLDKIRAFKFDESNLFIVDYDQPEEDQNDESANLPA